MEWFHFELISVCVDDSVAEKLRVFRRLQRRRCLKTMDFTISLMKSVAVRLDYMPYTKALLNQIDIRVVYWVALSFRRYIFILSIFLLLENAHGKIQVRKLDNGLKVIVETDARSSVVVQQLIYKVGSIDEVKGKTGISHVLEHMMFKGTKTYLSGELSKLIGQRGGRENAFTSKHYTGYYQIIASDSLELVMALEADRMRNLVLSDHELKRELQVVREERRSRVDDKPRAQLYEQFLATAYPESSEHFPVTGWPQDLNSLKLDDLRKWYDRWYRPNNAVLVIAGNVEPEKVFLLAQKYYGDYISVQSTKNNRAVRKTQNEIRRTTLSTDVTIPYLIMGFKVPSRVTLEEQEDASALTVLAAVLDGGNSARFSKNLVRSKKIAVSAGVAYNPFSPGDTLFTISATPATATTVLQLENAIFNEIELIKTKGINSDELKRVKAQMIASEVFSKDSLYRRALAIARIEALGFDHSELESYHDRIISVTEESVKKAAQLYLIKNRLTVGVIQPSHKSGE